MIPLLINAGLLLAQQPAPAPRIIAHVHGTVVNTLNGEGLRKTVVILRSSDTEKGISYAEDTDADGHFLIDDIQPGEYSLTAERPGYFQQSDGAPGAPAPRLKIAAGDRVDGLIVKMGQAASISGRVVDQDGDPVHGAVHVSQYFYVAGRRELRQGTQVQIKDNGEYRLFNLRPGRWFIRVTTQPGQNWIAPTRGRRINAPQTAFYPGVLDVANATPIELHAGDNLRGYDISVRSEAAYAIRFSMPQGSYTSLNMQLFYRDGTRPPSQTMSSTLEHQMQFVDVPPGAYTVIASKDNNASGTLYARVEVDVRNADADVGVLDFEPHRELSGSVKVDGGRAGLAQNLQILLLPEGASFGVNLDAAIKADGAFVFPAVAPGVYRLQVAPARSSFYLKSIRIGDRALPDQRVDLSKPLAGSLTVVLGEDVGEIEGTVKKGSGDPCVHARVTLFPAGADADRSERFRFVFSDEQGRFNFKSLAPGEYKIFAWEDVLAGQPQDPEFRKRFEKRGVAVKVGSNGHEKVDATSISVAAAREAVR